MGSIFSRSKVFLFITCWVWILALPFMGIRNASLLSLLVLSSVLLPLISSRFALPRTFLSVSGGLGKIVVWFKNRYKKKKRLMQFAFFWHIIVLFPVFMNNYKIEALTQAGIYIVLSLGLNVVVGLTGLLDLGYIAFYAVGAYAYALLSTKLGISFWLALPLGGILSALLGSLLGMITLRLRGDYLAIVTLGFIQIVHLVLNNWDSVTNGPNGIGNIGRPRILNYVFERPVHFYYIILALVFLTIFSVRRLNNSRIGRAWIAIREDELAAESMGIDTTSMKVLAFALGAFLAGIAGVFFAGKFAFVSPESFTFFESVTVLSMVVLGGMGSIPGVILGALIITILPEMFRVLSSYRMLIFGAALVLMMIFRPEGLIKRHDPHLEENLNG
ncbi:MAG TPA: branched-chain amino acid ABC transporter permease [Nitrospiria bacterium]|nr:branched-chain amino acid ABC transporter permease [Nitrospiria bacterium]